MYTVSHVHTQTHISQSKLKSIKRTRSTSRASLALGDEKVLQDFLTLAFSNRARVSRSRILIKCKTRVAARSRSGRKRNP